MKYTGYVYIWYDRKNKMFYVGSHLGRVEDKYVCSNTWMKNAHKKRPEDFKMRALEYDQGDKKSLQTKEQRWLDMISDNELSISKNVMEGCNRYYNMKKNAFGGSHKGHKKNRTKPAWNKGLTPEMIQLRRDGLFMLLNDKPIKNTARKGRLKGSIPCNKGLKMNKKTKPEFTKSCGKCSTNFKSYRENSKYCSVTCKNSANASKGWTTKKRKKQSEWATKNLAGWNKGKINQQASINGKKGAITQSKTVKGRKRFYNNDGSWTWQYKHTDGIWRLKPEK